MAISNNLFDIPESVALDPNIIKVIEGIAGAGKGKILDDWFKAHGIEYAKFLATNNLVRGHKYGDYKKTIASGLFTNEFPNYYTGFRYPDCKTIVIDEVLQSSPKVFDWCLANRGEYNIFITCDSHQMLTPDEEAENE